MQTYEAIMTRRSVAKPTDKEPERSQIERLLDAAVRAPNHHLTQPWRFIVLRGRALLEFGDAWAAGDEKRGKDPDAARTKALRAPVIICVVEHPKTEHSKVVEVEEHHATGAAIQNILLAAHDMGLGAMIRTGPAAELEEVRHYLGLGEKELVAAFIYLGFPAEGDSERPMSRRRPAAELTEWRGWE
ncbi:MAG: nitroreductase [Actinomycetota bacterium]